jgi:hypothetical protein
VAYPPSGGQGGAKLEGAPGRVIFFGSFFCSYKKRDSPNGEKERLEVAREEVRWGDTHNPP